MKTERKIVTLGVCEKCSLPVTMADKRRWIKKLDGSKTWKHLPCVDILDLPIPDIGAPENGNGNNHGDDAKKIADILAKFMPKQDSQIDLNNLNQLIEKSVSEKIASLSIPKTVEYKNHEGVVTGAIKNPHKQLETLLYLIGKRYHVYLYGEVGSGKSTAACQVSKILNLNFGYVSLNPQTPESRLIGFIDANGVYRETEFYRLYKNGGVFCIDEMDNSSMQLLTTLNSLLENGHGAFPCGMTERHKDFILVCTGNTNGRGANAAFPDRRSFDQAFSERFVFLQWNYDEELEKNIALQLNPKCKPWIGYIFELREFAKVHHKKLVVSPRATFKGASLLADGVLSIEEIADNVIFKGLDIDSVKSILSAHPLPEDQQGMKS